MSTSKVRWGGTSEDYRSVSTIWGNNPFTWNETTMHKLKVGDKLNLEFDIIGKYICRMMDARN